MRSLFASDATCTRCDLPGRLLTACVDPADDSVLSLWRDAHATFVCRNAKFVTSFEAASDGVLSFKYLSANDCLCVCLDNGDLWTVPLDASLDPETVGSLEGGIKAAEWSPDEELLVIINGLDQLLLMTKEFEVLSEGPLRATDFGEDKPVNVGWGHADTQFRGSVGKSAGRTTNVAETSDQLDPASDDFAPRISWRGDSAHFAVSCVDPSLPSTSQQGFKRVVRFYSRVAKLQATSEASPGMEHALAWQPSGSIIASTMRSQQGGRTKRDVIFFERNGLRRYDFPLRADDQTDIAVKALSWNADSSILAVWLDRQGQHSVQLFTRNNYHWYLKQEVDSAAPLVACFWHPERSSMLYLTTSSLVTRYAFEWETVRSTAAPPNDSGLVAVVDGSELLLTPFRHQNVPPPMSSFRVASKSATVPLHAVFASETDVLVAIYPGNTLQAWRCTAREASCVFTTQLEGLEGFMPFQIAASQTSAGELDVYVLSSSVDGEDMSYRLVAYRLQTTDGHADLLWQKSFESDHPQRLSAFRSALFFYLAGCIYRREVSEKAANHVYDLAEPPSHIQVAQVLDHQLVVSLTGAGRLLANAIPIESQVTSFTVCGDFLVYTTSSHIVRFILLDDLQPSRISSLDVTKCPTRKVERGSRIVTAVASTMSLVLQMPRGNLEIIYPRPMVLQVVRKLIKEAQYAEAFVHCRKHRIDLNILYDEDPSRLLANLELFVDQIKDADHLNLLLASFKNTPAAETEDELLTDKVNRLCQAIRGDLMNRDLSTYITCILTTYVCQQPPDYESALELVMQVKSSQPDLVDDAIKYMIFLSDTNKLYDVALGLYDFQLVLLVAQQSQKDPKEYLPFLREIKQLPDVHMQHFKIDDHLQRRSKALQSLILAGPSHADRVIDYVSMHRLYEDALRFYRHDLPRLQVMHTHFASYLYERAKYSEAALHYQLGGNRDKAIDTYALANDWQEAFALALDGVNAPTSSDRFDVARIPALARSIADRLQATTRYAEAGRVLLDYAQDVEASVQALCEGALYREAIRIAHLYSQAGLLASVVQPSMDEAVMTHMEGMDEFDAQVRKQVARLEELAVLRAKDPDAYFGAVDLSALDAGLDLDDSASTVAGTSFTRYTAAPTQVTRSATSTANTGKARRKDARKKQGGQKKGTIWEEDYLLGSLSRSVESRLAQLQKDVGELLPPLLTLDRHASSTFGKAQDLQVRLQALETEVQQVVEAVWGPRREELPKHDVVGMVKRPVVPSGQWSLAML